MDEHLVQWYRDSREQGYALYTLTMCKSEVFTLPQSCTSTASTQRGQCQAANTHKGIRALLHIKHNLIVSWESFLVSVMSAFTCKLRTSFLTTLATVQRPPIYRCCELIQLHARGGATLGSCITITLWAELISLALGCTDMTVVSAL